MSWQQRYIALETIEFSAQNISMLVLGSNLLLAIFDGGAVPAVCNKIALLSEIRILGSKIEFSLAGFTEEMSGLTFMDVMENLSFLCLMLTHPHLKMTSNWMENNQ